MRYSELKEHLLECVEYATPVSLKSLMKSFYMCEEVKGIRLVDIGFTYYNFDELKGRRTHYMGSYIRDTNGIPMYNNRPFYVIDKNGKILNEIWFGCEKWLNVLAGDTIQGTSLSENPVDWYNDIVYILSITEEITVDSSLF